MTQLDIAPRHAGRGDVPALTRMLAAAFQDDPLTRWILPDPSARRAALPGFFEVFVELSLDHGGILVTGDSDAALMYLSPTGLAAAHERDDEVTWRLANAVGSGAAPLLTILGMQAAHHPVHRAHYYISFGAVHPDLQRTRRMRDLLGSLTARADSEGMPVYTEASSPGGAGACRAAGFVGVGTEIQLPGGPTLRPYWREPR
ncbi:hypothetical protein ACTG9Q_30825 [Actinokineospora sp. 24-640]